MAGLHDPCSHPAAARLALKLVEEQYGETCKVVAKALLYHGTQTLGDLRRSTSQPLSQLKIALLALVQHNCVAAWLHAEPPNLRGEARVEQQYEAVPQAMLHSLRAPRLLILIKDTMGDTAEAVALALLQNGRLRLDQIVASLHSEAAPAETNGEDPAGSDTRSAAAIQTALLHLVHPNARKKKPAPKPGSEEEAEQGRAQAREQLHVAYQATRFKIPTDIANVAVLANAPADSGPEAVEQAGAGMRSPSLRKRLADAAEQRSTDILWRINFEEFDMRLRHDAIAEHMASKHGSAAGAVVRGMLSAYVGKALEGGAGSPPTRGVTPALSEAEVARAVRAREAPPPEGSGVAGQVPVVLAALAEDWGSCVACLGEGAGAGGRAYTLDVGAALGALRARHVETLLRERFGQDGVRVWRLLRASRRLEQKQVADFCMMDPRDAKLTLHRMLRAGYVSLQDVPRTADRAPSRTFYLWRAEEQAACAALTVELFLAAGNLHARLAHELSQRAELLRVLDLVGAGLAGTGALAERAADFSRIKRVTTLLEASLLHVSDSMVLFLED